MKNGRRLALSPKRPSPNAPVRSGDGAKTARSESASADPAREEVLAAAWRTFALVILASMLMLGVCAAGLAGAITFLVLMLTGKTRSAVHAGSGHAAIYAETFAVWMLLFLGLTFDAALIARRWPDSQLLVSSVASVLSLAVLMWPIHALLRH